MTLAAIFIGVAAAVMGCIVIEKKKRAGTVTYPLWRGNLFIPWGVFMVISASLVGSITLPHFVGLALHFAQTQGVILKSSGQEPCSVTYNYKADERPYTGSDNQCGLKPGEVRTLYYDSHAPESSTLYFPANALQNEIIATALICVILSTFLVVWFRMIYIIGSAKKP